MNFSRATMTIAALAGAATVGLAPTATAATAYQINVLPPIGTVYANNLVTLGVLVMPTPTGEDGTTPVLLELTEPDGDVTTRTLPLTLGGATVATRVHEAGRYVAEFTYDPPNSDEPATTTTEFDVVEGPSLGS
ncbi:hypothetical protein ACH47B_21125 [Rhodococcus sp. NPDC019627]|jgi:hypothetical protein|uniref:hypothetical protein n=1 Tax=Rhodococcus TaxID=1827 RepID=UPI00131F5DB7|nr:MULTISPECIES: hypothetical protein [Rhodococcus]MDV7356297.1 hypothetical protein [Rhodococcus oxybenzonivorans]QHE66606.1 hypothetical protein GFS60_00074 [Rhodococcus sp. WAY2]